MDAHDVPDPVLVPIAQNVFNMRSLAVHYLPVNFGGPRRAVEHGHFPSLDHDCSGRSPAGAGTGRRAVNLACLDDHVMNRWRRWCGVVPIDVQKEDPVERFASTRHPDARAGAIDPFAFDERHLVGHGAAIEEVSRFSIDDPSLPSSHPAAMTSDATTTARNTPRVRRAPSQHA